MKKFFVLVVLIMFLASCGSAAQPPADEEKPAQGEVGVDKDVIVSADKVSPGLKEFDAGGKVKFGVPEGWESKRFSYPDPAPDLVMAGMQTVFYPKSQDMEDIFKALSKGDFRYQQQNLGGRSYIIFMTGATTRFSADGVSYSRMTFYDGPTSNYKYGKIEIDKNKWDYCQADLGPPTIKYDGEAFMWLVYGKGRPLTTQVATSFYGFAFVARNVSSGDQEMLLNMVKSLKF